MITAQFHKVAWDHDLCTGVGKVHYPGFGVIAFYWEQGMPVYDVNFLNKDEMSFHRKNYQKETGRILTHGCIIDRDLEIVAVQERRYIVSPQENQSTTTLSRFSPSNKVALSGTEGVIYGIKALNLMIKIEGDNRYLADTEGTWHEFDEDTPHLAYERIQSLLGLDYGIKTK